MINEVITFKQHIDFVCSKVVNDLSAFKAQADIILANRITDDIQDVQDKVYTRDLFSRD